MIIDSFFLFQPDKSCSYLKEEAMFVSVGFKLIYSENWSVVYEQVMWPICSLYFVNIGERLAQKTLNFPYLDLQIRCKYERELETLFYLNMKAVTYL